MQDNSTVWNSIYAREGIVFSHPFDDVRHLADLFSQHGTQTNLDLGCRIGWHVLDGREAGLPHHYFTPEELHNLFKQLLAMDLLLDRDQHYCLTAVKR